MFCNRATWRRVRYSGRVSLPEQSKTVLQIATQCADLEEFARVFRPLCRDNLVFIATETPAKLGTRSMFEILSTSNGLIMAGEADVVSPFSGSLPTHGHPGMALRIETLQPGSESAFLALQTGAKSTSPFGFRASGSDIMDSSSAPARSDIEVCRVREVAKPRVSTRWPSQSAQAVPEAVADGGSSWADDASTGSDARVRGASFTEQRAAAVPHPAAQRTENAPKRHRKRLYAAAVLSAAAGVGVGSLWTSRSSDSPQSAPAPSAALAVEALGTGNAGTGNAATEPVDPQRAQLDDMAANVVVDGDPDELAGGCVADVVSSPGGAALFVDSAFVGTTPFQGLVHCDAKTASVHLPHYQSQELAIEPTDNEDLSIRLELVRPEHRLTIITRPPQAIVRIDGNKVGRSPVTVSVTGYEPHTVTATKKKYRKKQTEITTDGSSGDLVLKLKRKR